MKVFELFSEVAEDLEKVEEELHKAVRSDHPFLQEASVHLLNAGGKRLRPAFALLAGKFFDYDFDKLKPLAVALELIHMASLVHDDVVDASLERRGIPTVKAQWGNQVSMHSGDYLFAQSLRLIATYKKPHIARVLSEVSVQMCRGEIQQIISSFDLDQDLKDYFYRIKRKTALLISASCQCGALAVEAPEAMVRALTLYGHHLGMAFQITDDILDLVADQAELGKPIGGDLRQGIMTLPIIMALQYSSERDRLKSIIANDEKDEGDVEEAIAIIKASGAIAEAFSMSDRFIAKAHKHLDKLPDKPVKQTLATIADFINLRRY